MDMKSALREARDAYEQVLGGLNVSDDVRADTIGKLAVTLFIQNKGEAEKTETKSEGPMTPKQKSYIEDLCTVKGIPMPDLLPLSVSEASELIEKLKAESKG